MTIVEVLGNADTPLNNVSVSDIQNEKNGREAQIVL